MTRREKIFKNAVAALFYVSALMISALLYASFLSSGGGAALAAALAGGVLVVLANSFIHELGHVAFGSLNGFKTLGISFSVFSFGFCPERRFALRPPFLSDETDLVPTRGGKLVARFASSVAGGPLFGLVSAAAFTALFFAPFPVAVRAVFCAFPFCWTSFVLNALPSLVPDSDGSRLAELFDAGKRRAAEATLSAALALYEGKTFSEMPAELVFSAPGGEEALVLRLLCAEEKNDYPGMRSALDELEKVEERSDETELEMLAAYSWLGFEEGVAKHSSVLPLADVGFPLVRVRAAMFYAAYSGDKKYVDVALPSALSLCERAALKGEGKFTAEMLGRL